MGREGKVRKDGAGGGEKVGKWKGGLDLDICPGAVEFLVTALVVHHRCTQQTAVDQQ